MAVLGLFQGTCDLRKMNNLFVHLASKLLYTTYVAIFELSCLFIFTATNVGLFTLITLMLGDD
jgi:hypothetical protein